MRWIEAERTANIVAVIQHMSRLGYLDVLTDKKMTDYLEKQGIVVKKSKGKKSEIDVSKEVQDALLGSFAE